MEKAPNVFVETVDFGWNDLGTWRSLYEHSPKNKDGNVTLQLDKPSEEAGFYRLEADATKYDVND